MADEFDVELHGAVFNIEEPNICEGSLALNRNFSNLRRDDGATEVPAFDNDSPMQLSFASTTSGTEPPKNPSDELNGNSNPLMVDDDDGYDALLSQIDVETVVKSLPAERGHAKDDFPKTPGLQRNKEHVRSAENSPLKRNIAEENSSFFLSQINGKDQMPVKRRFPGPAGILPQLEGEELNFINKTPHPLYEKVCKVVSENSEITNVIARKPGKTSANGKGRGNEILLSKAPWKTLTQTLKLNIKDDDDILNILNINWIRQKFKRFPKDIKIPFLATVVQGALEIPHEKKFRHKNPSVRLMDPSGTIVAAFNPSFVDTFGDKIVPGTALALRNCGIIRLKKNLLLKVAKKNLLMLTVNKEDIEEDEESSKEKKDAAFSKKTENDVLVMQTGPLEVKKVLEEYQDISSNLIVIKPDQKDHKEANSRNNNNSFSEQSNRTGLFSSISSSTRIGSVASNPFVPPSVTAGKLLLSTSNSLPDFDSTTTTGFDEGDDEELLQALEAADFAMDEDSM